ncbi:MAG: DUF4260 family protein [Methylotenera sp.]
MKYRGISFALFFLTLPSDISSPGYLTGSAVGAISYNAAHSYIGAITCLIAGFSLASTVFIMCRSRLVCPHWL